MKPMIAVVYQVTYLSESRIKIKLDQDRECSYL